MLVYIYKCIVIYMEQYESMDEFREGIKEHFPGIINEFKREDGKVTRTLTLPKTFDTVFLRAIRADLLKFQDMEFTISNLLVGFAMVGLAAMTSDEIVNELSKAADFLKAYDESKLGRG